MEAAERWQRLKRAMPAAGLFDAKDWLLSPIPFPLDAATRNELGTLGHRLQIFQRAADLLHLLSRRGKQPRWIAAALDAGKPPALLEAAADPAFRDSLPQVIRPDLVLGEEGFAITELDSVPGGIGLTAWLNRTYAALGEEVVGGPDGMLEGFRSLLPGGGEVRISPESATYRPEMEWLCAQLGASGDGERWRVVSTGDPVPEAGDVYRFFELFDLPNLPSWPALLEGARAGRIRLTPPPKPWLEEKMWAALFWSRPLRDWWRRELGERHWLKLGRFFPQSWLLDPTPLPPHAVIPGLEIHDWSELGAFSQKARQLVIKVSGFSELAWGSRGVVVGQDVPHQEWQAAIRDALDQSDNAPRILQRFHHARLVEHPYFDRDTGEVRVLRGRVRLCPYYFVAGSEIRLGGVLATICPADKKILHGMRDAILAPCA